MKPDNNLENKPPDYTEISSESSEGVRKLTDIYMTACKTACMKFEIQRAMALQKYQKELEEIEKSEITTIAQLDNAMISALTTKLDTRVPWFYRFWKY